jgi:hypothetical protein
LITKETSLPDIRLENIGSGKLSCPYANERQLILVLVDPVDDEEVEEILQRLTMGSFEGQEKYFRS